MVYNDLNCFKHNLGGVIYIMKKIIFFVFALLTLLLTSCSTIMTGTSHNLTVNSNVMNAKVYVNNVYKGNAPINLELSKKEKVYTIKIEADGYIPYTETLQRKASGWVWGNIFLGGLIGLGVDMATGGLYVYDKDNITGNLNKVTVGNLKK